MEITVFSDIHLHNFSRFARIDPETGLNTRLIDGLKVLWDVFEYCKNTEDKTLLFCGDLFHDSRKVTPDIMMEVMSFMWALNENNIDAYALHGQHDHFAQNGSINSVSMFQGFMKTFENDCLSVLTTNNEEVHFIGCPNRKTVEEQKELLSRATVSLGALSGVKIFVGHFLVKEILQETGFKVDIPCVSYTDLPKGYDLYLFGDYHVYCHIPELKLISVGATHHHQFATYERDPGSFLSLNIEGNEITHKRILTSAPQFIKVDSSEGIERDKLNPKDYHRIYVKSVEEENILRERLLDYPHLEFIMEGKEEKKEDERPAFDVDLDVLSILKQYCDYKQVDEGYFNYGKKFIEPILPDSGT